MKNLRAMIEVKRNNRMVNERIKELVSVCK